MKPAHRSSNQPRLITTVGTFILLGPPIAGFWMMLLKLFLDPATNNQAATSLVGGFSFVAAWWLAPFSKGGYSMFVTLIPTAGAGLVYWLLLNYSLQRYPSLPNDRLAYIGRSTFLALFASAIAWAVSIGILFTLTTQHPIWQNLLVGLGSVLLAGFMFLPVGAVLGAFVAWWHSRKKRSNSALNPDAQKQRAG